VRSRSFPGALPLTLTELSELSEPSPLTISPRRAQRVWVVGSCGSGKTTLARRIGEVLGLGTAHVDDYIWLPGWKLRDREQRLELIEQRLDGPRWVMEGNLGRDAVRLWSIADRADLIVWLDLPFRVTFWRLLWRSLRRAFLREECCNGNRESLRQAFLSGESILLYAFRTRHRRRVVYRHMLRHRRHVRLRSARQVKGWMEALALCSEGTKGRDGA